MLKGVELALQALGGGAGVDASAVGTRQHLQKALRRLAVAFGQVPVQTHLQRRAQRRQQLCRLRPARGGGHAAGGAQAARFRQGDNGGVHRRVQCKVVGAQGDLLYGRGACHAAGWAKAQSLLLTNVPTATITSTAIKLTK